MALLKSFEEKIPYIEDSLFNSKLFLNLNLTNENLNNSETKESENSNEINDITDTCFLSKELIDELNSSNSDISLKEQKTTFNNKSFKNLNDNRYEYIPRNCINNIGNKEMFSYALNHNINNNYYRNSNYININKPYIKRYNIMIKEKKKDWICQLCFNLNYAFRTECNRCKVPKENCLRNYL